MHGIIGNFLSPLSTKDGTAQGWEPYAPSIFRIREVTRQLGYRPTLYVMRKLDGRRWLYRRCAPEELSAIETRDINRFSSQAAAS